ncbi:MAG: hypothetical protein D6698_17475 [Gammaproteobacteria bacterium]|nr:MAG: hypothetical protein D6698_17475 [Gammaproteobacteria bacterium]
MKRSLSISLDLIEEIEPGRGQDHLATVTALACLIGSEFDEPVWMSPVFELYDNIREVLWSYLADAQQRDRTRTHIEKMLRSTVLGDEVRRAIERIVFERSVFEYSRPKPHPATEYVLRWLWGLPADLVYVRDDVYELSPEFRKEHQRQFAGLTER